MVQVAPARYTGGHERSLADAPLDEARHDGRDVEELAGVEDDFAGRPLPTTGNS